MRQYHSRNVTADIVAAVILDMHRGKSKEIVPEVSLCDIKRKRKRKRKRKAID